MKYYIAFLFTVCTIFINPAWAQMQSDVAELSREWAQINYQLGKEKRKEAFESLAEKAAVVSRSYPNQAEPLIWEGIIVTSAAGEQGGIGFSALRMVKRARVLFQQAEQIDATALDGSIYTSLGCLYYQVPGWPLGFGDNKKAENYLQKALKINPHGIDPNYFYGDYLMKKKDYAAAIEAFNHALDAPPRANRPIADAGRREEVQQALIEAKKRLNL
jgi:tetratricopeptide (TPR) repeat protein